MVLFIFLLGLSIGSFLNVLIDRLPAEESVGGRSHCDHCKKKLSWQDLIPVASWVMLSGQCRYCHKKISAFYPLVELLTGTAFVFIFLSSTIHLQTLSSIFYLLFSLAIISSLIVIFFADLKYHIIPDEATIALIIFSLPAAFFSPNPADNILGGLVLLLIIYFLYWVTRGRGMGFGDVKLAFAMGFLLGVKSGFIALYLAFVLGGLFSLILIVFKKKGLKSKIAFGPFLVAGTIIMIFWQNEVMRFVYNFLKF